MRRSGSTSALMARRASTPRPCRRTSASTRAGASGACSAGATYYLCAVGEKMTAPFKLRVRGRSGHASDPHAADNALLRAAPLLEALARLEPPRTLVPEVAAFLELTSARCRRSRRPSHGREALDPLAAQLVAPLLAATLSPTMIEASAKRNVIPGTCVVEVDCRLLPGQPPAEMEALLRAALPGDWELEWIEAELVGGTRSPMATPLWEALQRWVDRIEPGARLAPLVTAGFTDSHYVRDRLGTTVYGFFPLKAMERSSRPGSCTPPTSASRSTTSSSGSTSSGTSRPPGSGDGPGARGGREPRLPGRRAGRRRRSRPLAAHRLGCPRDPACVGRARLVPGRRRDSRAAERLRTSSSRGSARPRPWRRQSVSLSAASTVTSATRCTWRSPPSSWARPSSSDGPFCSSMRRPSRSSSGRSSTGTRSRPSPGASARTTRRTAGRYRAGGRAYARGAPACRITAPTPAERIAATT